LLASKRGHQTSSSNGSMTLWHDSCCRQLELSGRCGLTRHRRAVLTKRDRCHSASAFENWRLVPGPCSASSRTRSDPLKTRLKRIHRHQGIAPAARQAATALDKALESDTEPSSVCTDSSEAA
jgi:hypothetical protein